jgi:transcription antitermination factor NusA-like protein
MRATDNDTPMIKMLVPHRHAGALIGKGGENMKRLETDSGARIKLSQSSEFYPETGERVLSARGDVNQVQRAVEMVLQSLEASGRGNQEEGAEMPAQQVRLIIPERAAGSLIGKGGENIRRLQEDSSSRVSVSGKVCLDLWWGKTRRGQHRAEK